ncbi:uncharacterized protein LOC143429638 [Xylocopa sonorina]|uniref:uncharacterized protein LOC143429638 n=1 Tax=Xylocopa sonorina TaxID=1818115 RepID=UPI00403AA673
MIGESSNDAQNGAAKGATTPAIVNLTQMNEEQLRKFLDSFDTVMSDCDGVLWYLDTPIPGSTKVLHALSKLGKNIYLVTNNSVVRKETYVEQLRSSGLNMKPEQVINTVRVISWYLKKVQFTGEAFVIGTPVFRQTLMEAGIKLAPAEIKFAKEELTHVVNALNDHASIKAVILDFSITYDWPKIAYVLSCLRREDVHYICGAQDNWIAYGVNKKLLGPGPMIDIITRFSGRTPVNCAKPSETFGQFVLKECNVRDPKKCLFIGDSLNSDIKFGKLCGFQTLLVGSGVNSIEDAEQSKEYRPDFYIPTLRLLSSSLDSICNTTVGKEGDDRGI